MWEEGEGHGEPQTGGDGGARNASTVAILAQGNVNGCRGNAGLFCCVGSTRAASLDAYATTRGERCREGDCVKSKKQKLTAPEGLPRRSPTLVLTGPCAA